MTYTGEVTPGGPADTRELAHLTITKLAVDPEMSNNCYLLTCRATGEMIEMVRRVRAGETDPHCPFCGGIVRATTILFEEALDAALGSGNFDMAVEADDENEAFSGPSGGAVGGTPAGKRARGGKKARSIAPRSERGDSATGP